MQAKPWKVRTYSGYAGGSTTKAKVTLLIETRANTVEEIRSKVEALPDLLAACQLIAHAETRLIQGAPGQLEAIVRVAQMAIAKAEGKPNA